MAFEYEEEIKNGVVGKDTIKFKDFVLNVWKPNYADDNLQITTLARYMEFLESRIFLAIRTFTIERYYSTSIDEFLSLSKTTKSK